MSIRKHLVLLCLLVLPAVASAGSLSALRFSDGWFLYGAGDNTSSSYRLPHHTVSRLELGERIAYVHANDGHYLYGVGDGRIVQLRLQHHTPNSVTLGDDLAVVQDNGRTYIYGLTRDTFHGIESPLQNPSQVRISGRLVLVSRGSALAIAGTTPGGVISANINGRPSNIQANRDTVVLQYSAGGTWIVSLGNGAFHQTNASAGHPSTIVLGGLKKDAQQRFDELHGASASPVEGPLY